MKFYKVNTNNDTSKDGDNRTLGTVINYLPLPAVAGIGLDKSKFYIAKHHLAQVQTIIELASLNLHGGFTEEVFRAVCMSKLAQAGFKPGYAEAYWDNYPEEDGVCKGICATELAWWIKKEIFAEVE